MRPRRLFWRVYLHGLQLLLVVGVAIFVVSAASGRYRQRDFPLRISRYVAAQIRPVVSDPPALERELQQINENLGLELAVYRIDGVPIAAIGDPPPTAQHETIPTLAQGSARTRHQPGAIIRLDRNHYLINRMPLRGDPAERAALTLAVVLAALALASVPLARSIAAPLERLKDATRRFGSGDLSARSGVRRRDELGEVAGAFDEMAERVQRMIEGEKELLANVSHELRTPIARLRIALELAEEGDADRARRYLADMGADLAELERLIEDVLTTARLDLSRGRPGTPLRLSLVQPAALLRRSRERFAGMHPDRELEVTIDGPLPELLLDETLFRRSIDNLLDNAVKYGDGVVRLRASIEEDELEVAVRDEGPGIHPDDLPRLFEPFYRAERSRTREAGGVGLGLTLVDRIVRAHGGSVEVRSEKPRGVAFVLRIPLHGSPEGAERVRMV